jgi:quinol monooxygenase YgiN
MIIVHGLFPIIPDQRQEALDLMYEMAIATKAESGCVSYEFYVAQTDPNQFLLFQEWESVDALQGHFETAHMEQFLEKLPSIIAGDIVTRRYEVRASDDMDGADYEDDHAEVESREASPKAAASSQPKIIH